jgi:hypothetical protein
MLHDSFEKAIAHITLGRAVAVRDVTFVSAKLPLEALVMNVQPDLLAQKIAQPHVVIAGKIVNGKAAVAQLVQFGEYLKVPVQNGVAIFEPKIEQISDNEQPVAAGFDVFQEFQDFRAAFRIFGAVRRPQMRIGKEEINWHYGVELSTDFFGALT